MLVKTIERNIKHKLVDLILVKKKKITLLYCRDISVQKNPITLNKSRLDNHIQKSEYIITMLGIIINSKVLMQCREYKRDFFTTQLKRYVLKRYVLKRYHVKEMIASRRIPVANYLPVMR